MADVLEEFAFLAGGGEMGARMRVLDWTSTPLGSPGNWPEALRTTVSTVLNSALLGTVLWGPDLRMLYNDAYAPALAERHPAALGRPIAEVWGAVWDQLAPGFLNVLRTGEPIFETRYALPMMRNGRHEDTFWNYSVAPIRDGTGRILGLLNQAIEITGEVRAEERQREAEARLRAANTGLRREVTERTADLDRAWRLSRDLLAVARPDGVLEAVNPPWTELLGWTEAELVGRSFAALTHPDDLPRTLEVFAGILEAPLTQPYEYRLRHRDGSYRRVAWTATCEAGKVYAGGRDVTLDRERDTTLRDTQDFARLALSAVGGVGVWTYDVDADLFTYDAAIATLYGLDPARGPAGVPRAAFLANVHPDDLASLDATMAGGLLNSGDLELEYRLRHPDGSVRWVLSRGHTHHDAQGRPVRRTGVGIETTNQRQTEEALRQSQKMEVVGQLTGGVAHDFNNLLTIIRSSVDLLRRPDLPAERRRRYVDAVSDTVDRATRLTGQLLAFARRQALKPEVFDVGAKLRGIGDMLDTVTGARIKVAVQVPERPCFVRADLSQFETALVNMAVNARDAMDGQGSLTLSLVGGLPMPSIRGHAASRNAFAAVSVGDTGSGIAPDLLAHIFEPFFTTKEVGKGTGLGLSQVFGFAKQSGGDVDVRSTMGEGTTFTLYLPEEDVAPTRAGDDEGDPWTAPDGAGLRVLVVEDNIEVGRFCTQILEDLGYATDWAPNAEEALDRLGTDGRGFDVVFSDVVMPGMGGVALAEALRDRLPDLPVVLTSGYSHVLARDADHGFELLHKPYSTEQLARTLQRARARRRA